MTRRFLVATVGLTAVVAFLVGLVVAGSMSPAPAVSSPTGPRVPARAPASAVAPDVVSFADIAERLNPAVVNIDATSRGSETRRRRFGMPLPDSPDLFERPFERDREGPRKGAGTGFLIDDDGFILTNHHVIDGADRILVRLTDGRTLRAQRVGSDPDTDIALIRVESPKPLPFATLGDSDTLRVGEWVCAIGNPLAYEHTVTVGVVSFVGRKLFDQSLDNYIQTDAAINFGNSGGPLINARGDVIGINAAISSRASNIGFAVPINQASAILPQLRETGRVSRGFIGVTLKDVDEDLQRSLGLKTARGALVQDLAANSPGARAGVRTYDVVTHVDGKPMANNDALIREIAARQPGSTATLSILRDGRSLSVPVKLSERPLRGNRAQQDGDAVGDERRTRPSSQRGPVLGLSVRAIDRDFIQRFRLPADLEGVVVSRVEPMSPAFDAEIERGHVVLEVNRRPVRTIEEFRRQTAAARPGDILAVYTYVPEIQQRQLRTVRIDEH
ncbi:MAG: trypsin-like peptidase domain-containing protein [Vicinamibacterales bacterium]